MSNNEIEWSSNWSRKLTSASGGSNMADGFDGEGKVIISRFGETAFTIGEMGQMSAMFVQKGLICGYMDDMKLTFVSLELGSFFDSLPDDSVNNLALGGWEVRSILETLNDARLFLFLSVFPRINTVRLELRRDANLVSEVEIADADFNKGFEGEITVEGFKLTYTAIQEGDEMMIAIGEKDADRRTLIPTSISNELDFMRVLESEASNRYWDLAEKIILQEKKRGGRRGTVSKR